MNLSGKKGGEFSLPLSPRIKGEPIKITEIAAWGIRISSSRVSVFYGLPTKALNTADKLYSTGV